MMSSRLPRAARGLLVVLLLSGFGLHLSAQTLLLMVEESSRSGPLDPPLAVREGVAQNLFAAGVIVVEVPPTYVRPPVLPAFARAAGADIILDVTASYTETPGAANRPDISVATTFSLIDAETGNTLAKASDDATNKDREAQVDRTALGEEIGVRIVAAAEKVLSAWSAGKK